MLLARRTSLIPSAARSNVKNMASDSGDGYRLGCRRSPRDVASVQKLGSRNAFMSNCNAFDAGLDKVGKQMASRTHAFL